MVKILRKKETYTVITPIPGFIPRQLALDILHSHSEVITVNPLVIDHKSISAPPNAPADEYYSSWYEITERIQYVPGFGKVGSGQLKFTGCFHNMPWGLQTHTYVPLGIELRQKYRIAGNQPGIEPPEPYELGGERLNIPKDGLYLRQESEIKCNIAMISFVKNTLKSASKQMVDRIIKKAELLDKGELQAMLEGGKIRTFNPNAQAQTGLVPERVTSPDMSSFAIPVSPIPGQAQPFNTYSPYGHRPESASPQPPQMYQGQCSQQQLFHQQQQFYQQQQYQQQQFQQHHAGPKPGDPIVMELPGDAYYPPTSPGLPHSNRTSTLSNPTHSLQPDPHRASLNSIASGGAVPQSFSAELPAHSETKEEHRR